MGQHVFRTPANIPRGGDPGLDDYRGQFCLFCGLTPTRDYAMLPYRCGGHVRFSMDCDVAQEQVRFYVLGILLGVSALDKSRYGNRVIQTMEEALIGGDPAPIVYVVRAFELLQKHPGVLLDDVEWELKGGRPMSTDPPLDVDL